MLKDSKTIIPYDDIDYEIRELVKCMNSIDGIETTSSCCGHLKMPCLIYFKADNTETVTKFIHKYLYCNKLWRVSFNMTDIDIDNGEWDKPTYLLETTFPDYFYVGLVIDNLTYKMQQKSYKGISKSCCDCENPCENEQIIDYEHRAKECPLDKE